jgi:leader peptidase (prepilin peptidase)/N-methyltransferase
MTQFHEAWEVLVPALPLVLPAGLAGGAAAALAARGLGQTEQPSVIPMIALSILLDLWAALVVPGLTLLAVTCALCWALLVLSKVDADTFRLPDIITLPLLVAGLGVAWFLPDRDILGHAIGAAAGLGSFYAIAEIYLRTRGQEGLGLGDAKLAGAAGAWLGWQALPSTILLAACAGLMWVGIGVLRRGRPALRERIPFGVALCIAIWIVWLYGPLELVGS